MEMTKVKINIKDLIMCELTKNNGGLILTCSRAQWSDKNTFEFRNLGENCQGIHAMINEMLSELN
jgi:hypothetical protein